MLVLQITNCAKFLTPILLIVYVGMCIDYAINLKVHQDMQNLNFESIISNLEEL